MIVEMATATVRKDRIPQPPRSKSTNSRPSKPLTRTLKVNVPSANVFKTRSDSSLVTGMKNLTFRDQNNSSGGGRNSSQGGRNSSPSRAGSRSSTRPSSSSRRFLSSGSASCKSVEDIAKHIRHRAKNIVVMAGAGISTSSGIPDFRSPGTGLYDNLKQYKIPYPQAIFDIDYFDHNPRPFFALAREIFPTGKYRPNYAHFFCRLLHEKGLLHRMYTQNIDGLERSAGIPQQKLVEAHGTFSSATCTYCGLAHSPEEIKVAIFEDKLPKCKRKTCLGIVKPDIVFFGEDLPRRFYYYLRDFPQADLLIVMGTSLEVEPFAGIVDAVRLYIPRILFNREAVGPFTNRRRINDVVADGDLVENIKKLVRALGWQREMEVLIRQHEGEHIGNELTVNLNNNCLNGETKSTESDTKDDDRTNTSTSNRLATAQAKNGRDAKPPLGVAYRGRPGLDRSSRRFQSTSAKAKLEIYNNGKTQPWRRGLRDESPSRGGKNKVNLPRITYQKRTEPVSASTWRKPRPPVSSSSSEESSEEADSSDSN